MPRDIDMIDIIHRRSPDPAVIPFEPHRFDEIHGRPEARSKPQNGTDVSSDFRLK
jgi:hypothetical protein